MNNMLSGEKGNSCIVPLLGGVGRGGRGPLAKTCWRFVLFAHCNDAFVPRLDIG